MTKDEALKLALEALEAVAIEGDVACVVKPDGAIYLRPAITAIKEALAQPVQEPEYWNVIDPAGNVVASETDAIRGWARIAGSYKPTVEGLLGFHEQGWRVLPKVTPPAPLPMQERNFCPRCGKRTADPTTIHTCTPPQENT
jgi:hypothetical protein